MPKQTLVAIAAGAGYTDVPANIAAHYVKIYQDGDRVDAFEYKLPGDGFTTVFKTEGGTSGASETGGLADIIELVGNARNGIVGRPANYSYKGQVADVYIKMRQAGGAGAGTNIVLMESEGPI